jgi:hypothetical protein
MRKAYRNQVAFPTLFEDVLIGRSLVMKRRVCRPIPLCIHTHTKRQTIPASLVNFPFPTRHIRFQPTFKRHALHRNIHKHKQTDRDKDRDRDRDRDSGRDSDRDTDRDPDQPNRRERERERERGREKRELRGRKGGRETRERERESGGEHEQTT